MLDVQTRDRLAQVSDWVIAGAYFAILVQLLALIFVLATPLLRKPRFMAFLGLCAAFITLCGCTHACSALRLPWPNAVLKPATAAVAIVTALLLGSVMPDLLALPRRVAELDETVSDLLPPAAAAAHQADGASQRVQRAVLERRPAFEVGALLELAQAHLPYVAEHGDVTILFADVVSFTPMAAEASPRATMSLLHRLFCRVDCLALELGVYKLETVGDCVVLASGLDLPGPPAHWARLSGGSAPRSVRRARSVRLSGGSAPRSVRLHPQEPPTAPAPLMVELAVRMFGAVQGLAAPGGAPVRLRCGISSGPAVSGIVGLSRRRFSIYGNTINTASRMETTSRPGCIQLDAATHERLPAQTQRLFERAEVCIKGKGVMPVFRHWPHPDPDPDPDPPPPPPPPHPQEDRDGYMSV
jgi:class 3 adenylate cyclase